MSLTKVNHLLSTALKLFQPSLTQCEKIHTSCRNFASKKDDRPTHWMEYNNKIYPPQTPDEVPRLAYVCNQRLNIKYSPLKMWYIASFIRGMSVDEAIKQLKFVLKKGAKDIREVLEEAKEMAVKEHNVEFPSNMWIAESFTGKGKVIKGMRRHARGRFGVVEYKHVHYYVRLEEGSPPEHYYQPYPKKPHEQLADWLEGMRRRKITNSL